MKVSRQGADGRHVSAGYALEEIEESLIPDPSIRAGDRIEVSRAKINDRHRFDQDKCLAALAPTLYYPLRQV